MPSPNLFDPPLTYTLPVSLGADIAVTFRNVEPGSDPPVPVDYPPGVTVSLVVGKAGATVAEGDAVISGSDAVCTIPAAIADTLKAGLPWRCVVDLGDSSGPLVPLNGPVGRFDGT